MGLFEPPSLLGWETRAQQSVGELQTHLSDLTVLAIAAVGVLVPILFGLRRRADR
jgi:hypothetical protein